MGRDLDLILNILKGRKEMMDIQNRRIECLERRTESLQEQLTEAERRIKLEQQWRKDKFGWRYD